MTQFGSCWPDPQHISRYWSWHLLSDCWDPLAPKLTLVLGFSACPTDRGGSWSSEHSCSPTLYISPHHCCMPVTRHSSLPGSPLLTVSKNEVYTRTTGTRLTSSPATAWHTIPQSCWTKFFKTGKCFPTSTLCSSCSWNALSLARKFHLFPVPLYMSAGIWLAFPCVLNVQVNTGVYSNCFLAAFLITVSLALFWAPWVQELCIDKTLNLDNHEVQKCNSNSWRDLLGRKDLG